MAVTTEEADRLIEIAEHHTTEMFAALRAALHGKTPDGEGLELEQMIGDNPGYGLTIGDPLKSRSGYDEPWAADKLNAPTGGWMELKRVEEGETYGWPDSSVDKYFPYVTYAGTGANTGTTLALGYKNDGTVVGFIVGATGGSKRGLTVFFKADDFDKTNEKVSMIRGGGKRGRAGFGPGDALPSAYDGFKVEILRDRYAGKWNVQAVVADADDHETMLNHTMLQAKLRGLA